MTDIRARRAPPPVLLSRHVFIVARDNPSLHDYLRGEFTLDTNVEVVVDRRRCARRTRQISVDVDRRRCDRRSRPHVDAELRVRTHVFVTIPARPEVHAAES